MSFPKWGFISMVVLLVGGAIYGLYIHDYLQETMRVADIGFLCMRMSILINKFKIIRYFIKNGIFNEERAIEISKFDHNTIEALVHSQLLVQVDGRVYLDKPLYDFRYKEKYIYYGEIILLIILLIFASYVHYLKTTLFWRQ